jgi:major membrane immunogen (membrane-anchored lipoprotein)
MMLPYLLFISVVQASFFGTQQVLTSDDQYTINDILQRYRNLTESHREISFFQNQPEYDTSCVKAAITPILSQCLKKPLSELDPRARSQTAAKLSICEFEVAGIEYPDECHTRGGYFFGSDSVDYNSCVLALEKKSQWWTSYSGYYRSIGDICLQETLPYEKEEIWNMFLDVTTYYGKVFDCLHDYVDMSQKFKDESEGTFDKMREFMEQIQKESTRSKNEFRLMWDYINKQMETMSQMGANVTAMAKLQSDSIGQNMFSFFDSIDAEFSQQLDILRLKFITDLEERDLLMHKSLDDTRVLLQGLNGLTLRTVDLHRELNDNLEANTESARALDESLSSIDDHVDGLTIEIKDAKELMTDINDILENNVLVRTLLYVSREVSMTLEFLILFSGISIMCFVCFILLSYRVNVFKYIGILFVSVALGGILGSAVMFVGGVINEQLEEQVA